MATRGGSWEQPGAGHIVVATLTGRAYIGAMAMTDEEAVKRHLYPGRRYTMGVQATYLGGDILEPRFAAEAVREHPLVTVPDRILAFGGTWFFLLFLLQAVAEFTNALPNSLANAAYSLAAAFVLTVAVTRWGWPTSGT